MMTGANGKAVDLIEYRGQEVWLNITEVKRYNAETFACSRSIDGQPGNRLQLRHCIRSNFLFVPAYIFHSKLIKVINSSTQADRLGDSRRTGLKFPGQVVPGGFTQSNFANHFTATHERGHVL